jgi:homoserine O-succinyltransferase
MSGASGPRRRIRVGLVNNMPDSAVAATERQFSSLLRAAVPDGELELGLFEIPEVQRHPNMRRLMAGRYQPAEAIAGAGLSALVVTGASTGVGELKDTPYWASFTRLVDATQALGLSTLWSCLAAHAAVEYLDGIQRRPLAAKRSGFYCCAPSAEHPLLAGLGGGWRVPHSRYNDLAEADLRAAGYLILTRSADAGADVFLRPGPPLFLFCQGHPEYERDSLALEYQRDVREYVKGARAEPPVPPVGAIDARMAHTFAELGAAAAERRSPDVVPPRPDRSGDAEEPPEWRRFAAGLYRNWLSAIV